MNGEQQETIHSVAQPPEPANYAPEMYVESAGWMICNFK